MNHLKEKLGKYLYELVHESPAGGFSVFKSIVLALLEFLSFIYQGLAWTKRSLYQYGILKTHKLTCPVISLGNITMGGTGKTPAAKSLALIIREKGFRVAVLNRGYRSSYQGEAALVSDGERIYMNVKEAGDEAYLLAKTLPGVIVVIGANRAVAGRFAIEKGAQAIIIDDGYQHWRLKRDLDIVLIDTLNPFGNKHTLPRGILREPLACLDRAGIFFLTKTNQSAQAVTGTVLKEIRKYNLQAPILKSSHQPGSFIEINTWLGRPAGKENMPDVSKTFVDFKKNEVIAFSALGNPASFEQTIHSLGVKTAAFISYPDHHQYTVDELLKMSAKAAELNAKALLTTEKDAVKIPEDFLKIQKIPIYVLPIEVIFHEGYEELTKIIGSVLDKNTKGA